MSDKIVLNQKETFFKSYRSAMRLSTINNVELDLYCKNIYCYCLSFAESTGDVRPSYATIAEDLGISTRTVIRSVKKLEDAGLFLVDRNTNKRNNYIVLWWEDVVSKPTEQKPQPVPKPVAPKTAPVLENKQYTNDPWDFGDDPNVPF